MKMWQHNIVGIIKSPEFRECLLACLNELEGDRNHSIVLSMLNNYFSLRNKGFGSNWLFLPESKATLYINRRGIYFMPAPNYSVDMLDKIVSNNQGLYESIGEPSWVLTFSRTKTLSREEITCQIKQKTL